MLFQQAASLFGQVIVEPDLRRVRLAAAAAAYLDALACVRIWRQLQVILFLQPTKHTQQINGQVSNAGVMPGSALVCVMQH